MNRSDNTEDFSVIPPPLLTHTWMSRQVTSSPKAVEITHRLQSSSGKDIQDTQEEMPVAVVHADCPVCQPTLGQ
jgi:hypothetical protein